MPHPWVNRINYKYQILEVYGGIFASYIQLKVKIKLEIIYMMNLNYQKIKVMLVRLQ